MLRRANVCIYWPGMSAEMTHHISTCETCRELDNTTHAKETLMSHEVPSRGWEVDRLQNTKASTTILKLKNHFAHYGIPG